MLNYEIFDIEKEYYADGEDAYDMRFYFDKSKQPLTYSERGGTPLKPELEESKTTILEPIQEVKKKNNKKKNKKKNKK